MKSLNRTSIVLLFLFIALQYWNKGMAQDKYTVKSFYEEKNLDKKAAIANRLWDQMHQSNIDTLRQIAVEMIILGNEERNTLAINIGKRALGSSLIRSGEGEKGIAYLRAALIYFRKQGNRLMEVELLSEIGNGYLNLGEASKAENYYLQSLKAGKYCDDPTAKFMAEINLAQAYIQLKDYPKAISYLMHYKGESLKLGKLESVGSAYALLGNIEEIRENFPLATEYYQKSADFGKRSKSKNQVAHALNNLAIVYFRKGMPDSSLILFERALELRQEVGNARFIAESYFNIGGLYFELGKYDKAEEFYDKSLVFAQSKNLRREEMDAIMSLIELKKAQGKEKDLVGLYDSYNAIQEDFNAQQKEENTLQATVLEDIDKLESEREKEEQAARFRAIEQKDRQKWWIVYGVGIALCLLLAILVLQKRANKTKSEDSPV